MISGVNFFSYLIVFFYSTYQQLTIWFFLHFLKLIKIQSTMLTERKITVFFDLPAAHDKLLRDRPTIAKLNLQEILTRSEAADIHLLKVRDNTSNRIDKLAIVVVNNDTPHILALDVENVVGWVREEINAGKVMVINPHGDGQV